MFVKMKVSSILIGTLCPAVFLLSGCGSGSGNQSNGVSSLGSGARTFTLKVGETKKIDKTDSGEIVEFGLLEITNDSRCYRADVSDSPCAAPDSFRAKVAFKRGSASVEEVVTAQLFPQVIAPTGMEPGYQYGVADVKPKVTREAIAQKDYRITFVIRRS